MLLSGRVAGTPAVREASRETRVLIYRTILSFFCTTSRAVTFPHALSLIQLYRQSIRIRKESEFLSGEFICADQLCHYPSFR
ncbi:MAG: hypothetical protein K0S33_4116 [Bacteroidetes bacterium]|nr:hypothetical protein [Bacteroidota bacterium]